MEAAGPSQKTGGGVSKSNQEIRKPRFGLKSKTRQTESLQNLQGNAALGYYSKIPGVKKLSEFEYDHSGKLKTPGSPELEELKKYTDAVALDCEMVGVGPNGRRSSLARVSIVNEHGYCLYDSLAKPPVPVTDYRTKFSGVRKEDLEDAPLADDVKQKVAEHVKGHILVGHGLEHDLTALGLENSFPLESVRDTALYFLPGGFRPMTPGLKSLAKDHLGFTIQTGEHSSITDAQAVMAIYEKHKTDWEEGRGGGAGEKEIQILKDRLMKVKDSGKFSLP